METSWKPHDVILWWQEAASLGIISCVSFKQSPVIVDTRELQIHTAEVSSLSKVKVNFLQKCEIFEFYL